MGGHIRKRVNKKGTTWQIIIEDGLDNKGRRKRVFKAKFGTKKEAEQELRKMLEAKEQGISIKPQHITLAEYLRNWFKNYVEVNLAPTTADGYRYNIEKHIILYIGTAKIQELRPDQIRGLYDKLQEKGLSAKSIRYVHRNLRQALQEAVDMKMIAQNPAASIKLPKVKKYRSEVYNESEIRTLLEKIRGTDMELPITLDVVFGLRRGELLALKWSNIDFKERKLAVVGNLISTSRGTMLRETKTESSRRIIDIPESIIGILLRHKEEQQKNKTMLGEKYIDLDLVCCHGDGRFINPKYFSNKFRKFLDRKGLKKIRLHDIRHSNATLMLTYGVPVKIAAQRLGHSSVSVTLDIYSHVLQEMQNEVTEKIECGILRQIPDKTD